ncbi:MAG: endo-1,4-beta-xylanase [Kiritimatiellia bacterium]
MTDSVLRAARLMMPSGVALSCALVAAEPFEADRSVLSDKYWEIWNDGVQRQIDADIEANRKADGVFEVAAADGTAVQVEQIDHDFRFGAHIFNFDQLGNSSWNDAYKASYGPGGIFNQATVAFYWNKYEPVPNRLRTGGGYEDTAGFWNSLTRDEAVEHSFWRRPAPGPVVSYLRGRGVRIHGHVLIWGLAKPDWIYDWYCPEEEKRAFDGLGIPRNDGQTVRRDGGSPGDYGKAWRAAWQKLNAQSNMTEAAVAALAPAFVKRLPEIFRKRVFDVAAGFGEVVDSWDVVNESSGDWARYRKSRTGLPVWMTWYGLMPGDYPLHALLDAKKAFPEKAKLAINDWNVGDDFLAQVRDLEGEGAKIDVVGCQMHLFDTNDCMRLANGEMKVKWVGTPEAIEKHLDLMARAGRPLHISEVTIASPGSDGRARMIQAVLARNLYRKWFSHEAVTGITWWNTVDGGGVKGEPLVSGLFTSDLKKKPAYLALDQLINREWKTKQVVFAKDGKVGFRGFCGRYRLTWQDECGQTQVKFAELAARRCRKRMK